MRREIGRDFAAGRGDRFNNPDEQPRKNWNIARTMNVISTASTTATMRQDESI